MENSNWAVLGAIALNVEYLRKYMFHARGASKVKAKMVRVPPPRPLVELFEAVRSRRLEQAAKEN